MHRLYVEIVRFVDESQPGIVECQFVDADGGLHTLIDKVPMFSEDDLSANSNYPRPGVARCKIIARSQDEVKRELLRITIAEPDRLGTLNGEFEFVVCESQVSEGI